MTFLSTVLPSLSQLEDVSKQVVSETMQLPALSDSPLSSQALLDFLLNGEKSNASVCLHVAVRETTLCFFVLFFFL